MRNLDHTSSNNKTEPTLQELELVVRFYVSDKELRNELISDLKHLIEKAERKAYKQGYIDGGIEEILRTETARKKVITELSDKGVE